MKKHPHARGEDNFTSLIPKRILETSPRPWGRRHLLFMQVNEYRNIPTPVGKTVCKALTAFLFWKHPHARGEDFDYACFLRVNRETSPRPWGRHRQVAKVSSYARNIPTPVGKTATDRKTEDFFKKHPHARGEDRSVTTRARCITETSPRPWGRQQRLRCLDPFSGNIPTPVGKTILLRRKRGVS